MSLSEKHVKLLWGRSGNRCAICKTELTQDKASARGSYVVGEHAHIVAEKNTTDSPRGKSSLTEEEREGYHNRILLCPTDHTKIDKNPEDWPIEKLHKIKTEHEQWVQQSLAEKRDEKQLANEAIVAAIIDEAVEKCRLRYFDAWISHALDPDPCWPSDLPRSIFEFRQKVLKAVWPNEFGELKQATITFSVLMHRAAEKFKEHCMRHNDQLLPEKFYKAISYNPNYDRDLHAYNEWLKLCHNTVMDAVKAANWFAEIVRRDINPMFFAIEGKFSATYGPMEDLSYRTMIPEFTAEEKSALPDSLFER